MKLATQPHATPEDLALWSRVANKLEVQEKLEVLEAAINAGRGGRKVLAAAALKHGWVNPEKKRGRLPEETGERGWSLQQLERLRHRIKKGEGWEVAIDGAKTPAAVGRGLPSLFIEYWRKLCEDQKRTYDGCREAHRQLLLTLRSGEPIPGLGTWKQLYAVEFEHLDLPPSCPPHYIPRGLTYSNLMQHAPSSFELQLARRGRSAAAHYRPLVLATRRGCHVGQFYMFDDYVSDVKVITGRGQLFRPIELDVLDFTSGCQFEHGMLRVSENEEGVKQSIKQRHMRLFVAHVLMNTGYARKGSTLILENATASLPEELDGMLDAWTDGAVQVQRSAVERAELVPGLFKPDPKGNPRFKAALESLHKLKHIMASALPGQTGKDRDHAPAEYYGRDQYTQKLSRELLDLAERSPAVADALEQYLFFGHMKFDHFARLALELYDRMNRRDDHNLEGWDDFVEAVFVAFPGAAGVSINELKRMPEAEVAGIRALIASDPARYTSMRRLSPWQVWQRGRGELIQLSWVHLPLLAGPANGVERVLGDGADDPYQFAFEDAEFGPGRMVFLGELTTPTGSRQMLRAGEGYLTFVLPHDPRRMVVCKRSSRPGEVGQVLGWVPRRDVPCRGDVEAMGHQIGTIERIRRNLEAPVLARHAGEAAAEKARQDHNTILIEAAKSVAAGKQPEEPSMPESVVSDWAKHA